MTKRGFAGMDREKQREIASRGGKAAHEQGLRPSFDSEQAQIQGKKGGRRVSKDRKHMAEIGRRGGKRSAEGRKRAKEEREKESA